MLPSVGGFRDILVQLELMNGLMTHELDCPQTLTRVGWREGGN